MGSVKQSPFAGVVFLSALSFLVFNETTKTYMFTPHSQLFNVLLPVWVVYLCDSLTKEKGKRWFWSVFFSTFFFALNYKLFIVAFFPIVIIGKRLYGRRAIFLSGVALLCVVLLPQTVVQVSGGKFDNYDVSHYRTVVWILDVLKGDSPPNLILGNLRNLAESVPLIPFLCVLSLMFIYFKWLKQSVDRIESSALFATFFAYLGLLAVLGFSARRLSLSLLSILLFSLLLWLSKRTSVSRPLKTAIYVSIPIQFVMWLVTLGPLA